MTFSYSQFAVSRDAHGIMFHHFHGGGHPVVQGSIGADQLASMLDFLGGHQRILDARLWMEKALAGSLEANDLCLTFDDSLLCQKEVAAPLIKALGFTGIFFVNSSVFQGGLEPLEIYRAFRTRHFENVDAFYQQFFLMVEESPSRDVYRKAIKDFQPEKYLTELPFYSDEDRKFRFVRDKVLAPPAYNHLMDSMIEATTSIKTLSESLWMNDDHLRDLTNEGHLIGLHSYTHPTTLAEMPPEAQKSEYHYNFEHLEGLLGTSPQAVAHPCNSYDATTLELLRGLGVEIGFRRNMTRLGGTGLEYLREDHANILAMMQRRPQ